MSRPSARSMRRSRFAVRSALAVVAAAAGFLVAAPARADDFFEVIAETTGGTPETITAGGENLIDLAEDLLDADSAFESLEGQPFDASLTYGGVEDALLFSSNAAGTSVTLTIPSTGFTRTFTGASRDDVEDQIEDFLREEGAGEYAKFLRAINETSPVAAVDGNPQASTAFIARHAFDRFGTGHTLSLGRVNSDNNGEFRADFATGAIDTDVADGSYVGGSLGTAWRFGDNVGLSWSTAAQLRQVEGTDAWTIGTVLGLPVALVNTADPEAERASFGWQVVPFGLAGLSASEDLAAGGLLVGGGATNVLAFRAGALTFAIGNQLAYFNGTDVSYGDYEFQTDVDQPILTNGAKVTVGDATGGPFLDAGISHTTFLDDAAVEDYFTPTAGAGVRFGPYSGVRVGYTGDFGDDYTSHGGSVVLFLAY